MNDLSKKILELASEDQGFYESFTKAADPDAAVALLKERGIEASAEELEAALKHEEAGDLSENELEAVAGGGVCVCPAVGGGATGGNDSACACVAGGVGAVSFSNSGRCACFFGGYGGSAN